ncbi:MAG TPA: ABC transporter permease [Miltoncostaeales bacterium]|jgi:ABC-type nitrate/sulfonate/bicarbonate transport system permease component|nr:ABC transporter permease [Miltoncostaeales bacterium]
MSRRTLGRVGPPVGLVAALVGLWEAWVRAGSVDPAVFPAPTAVARALSSQSAALVGHARTTLAETGVGLALGIVLGLGVAALIAGWPLARHALEPVLVALQTIPAVVLAPILVLLLGFGWGPRIVVVIGVVFFPVAIAAAGAFTTADPARLELVRAFGATPWQTFRTVILPGSLPAIFDGVRISAAYALGSAAVAEQIGGAESGIGLFISRAQRNFRPDYVLAGVVVIAALSLVIYAAVGALAHLLTPWNTTTHPEPPA